MSYNPQRPAAARLDARMDALADYRSALFVEDARVKLLLEDSGLAASAGPLPERGGERGAGVERAASPAAPRNDVGRGVMPTLVTLFSGGGLADVGYRAAGFEPIGAVEFEASIAEWYVRNLGDHCRIASVSDVDYRPWAGVDLLHVSPPCTNASVANQKAGETEQDLENAAAVCRALREMRPRWFVLENVTGYAKFKSYRQVLITLLELGYACSESVENSADYGVPQTRKRLFLRAVRSGRVPELRPTHCKGGESGGMFSEFSVPAWNGWYAAIEDLLPGLPDGKLAPWQLKRMPAWLKTCLVNGVHRTDADLTVRPLDEPAHTITSTAMRRPCTAPKAVLVSNAATEYSDGLRDPNEPAFSATGEQGGRLRALLSGEWDGPQREGRALRAFTEDEPSSAVMSSTHKRQPCAVLVGNQQGAATETGREPMMCQRDEQAHPVTASLHAKGKLPVGVLIGDQRRPVAAAERPAFTVRAGEHGGAEPKACLGAARVVTITPRCLARFQSVPDDYALPEKNSLACKIIGNGVACTMAQVIGEAFLRGDR